jgi:hypothetical protein
MIFLKIGSVKAILILLPHMNIRPIFYIFRPIWAQFGTVNVYRNLLCDYELRVNRRCESHNLIKGVNVFIRVLSTFVVLLW